ncbi:hypothetical protein MTER_37030 [Mycolicibacter terrae]|uniref:Uncharacterized protein n=1 Tax=Mycolicibacter terrae TaxID=1788 RepID=A0AAD1HZ45_9MYCO|nr:hypothetical protein MTER_37030 [Mycolicibacter terrae]SNV54584.1 Uncharacterised protein [Mycolicibacter terrae]
MLVVLSNAVKVESVPLKSIFCRAAVHRADVLPDLATELATSAGLADSPLPRTMRALHASALSGALTALVLDWADGRLPVSRAELGGYATRLVLAGLG